MKLFELNRTANMAHRGARSWPRRNTLSAARKGFECGADAWELDVSVTADGELVLLHDRTLTRTSNVDEVFPKRRQDPVHTFTLAELRQLDFGAWFNRADPFGQIAAGAVTLEMQRSYVGEPILTFREALLFTREHHWQVNVEIKDASGTAADSFVVSKVVQMVQELEMVESALISSFNHDYLRRARALDGHIATAAIAERPVADPIAYVRELGASGYNPGGKALIPQQILALVQAGIFVVAWTINDPTAMRELIQAGVSSICTDFPQELALVLARG